MESLYSSEPWYLTIVRTQGISFLRPEKSWRPIVNVTVVDTDQTLETVLGCDGQNPNLKTPFVIRDISFASRLDIRVYHKSQSKNRKKRNLVGSAYVSIGELVRRQSRPGCDLTIRLSCPPPQKRCHTVGGTRLLNSAILVIRLRSPHPLTPSSSVTLVASTSGSQQGDNCLSDDTPSDVPLVSPSISAFDTADHPVIEASVPDEQSTLRRRRKKPKFRGYSINTSDDEPCPSSAETSSFPPSPISQTPFLPDSYDSDAEMSFKPSFDDEADITMVTIVDAEGLMVPSILPRHVGEMGAGDSLSTVERMVDVFAPYKELSEATDEGDIDKVLGRLLTEWYVVGASLLAVAGLNATIFGLSSGTLFKVDGLAQRCVAFGSIAAGIGIAADAWFLVLYSGTNAAKFEKQARDVYGTYFFFCLTCRLPTLCMFLASCALTLFLLTVAWSAWPTAVLVMSFVAGTLFSLQYLVFGFHRMANMCIWVVKTSFRWLARVLRRGPTFPVPELAESPPPICEVASPAAEVASPSPVHNPTG